jgi:3-hydroxy-9,10-secoandrosta-1,3,5(10)-triene-9,17-dione monooxygenase
MEVSMAEPTTEPPAVREILDKVTAQSDTVDPKSLGVPHGSLAGQTLKPARYGGSALGTEEFIAQVCELAALDGSLGWVAATFNAAAYEVALLPTDVADAVWGSDPDAVVTSTLHGDGAVDPDLRLTGRWASVVGAEYADWLVLPASSARRILVPRDAAHIEPIREPVGLGAAGVCDVTVTEYIAGRGHVFTGDPGAAAVFMAGMAAAVAGSADGVWRQHVDQMRVRLATSYSGDEVTNAAPAQVARAASDIDAAKLQIAEAVRRSDAATWVYHQAVARARIAADRVLANSRHALDQTDPATRLWRDVHAGCRLAAGFLDAGA